jgi:acyl-CoA reductase-like NAD-dependent aldehyde dehydrogenase
VSIIIPAILTGNSVLLKDHPSTPIFSKFFEKSVSVEAPGLVQRCFVHRAMVKKLYEENAVQYVSFSGQYSTGLEVYHQMGQENFMDFDLDIGGFNQVYVG